MDELEKWMDEVLQEEERQQRVWRNIQEEADARNRAQEEYLLPYSFPKFDTDEAISNAIDKYREYLSDKTASGINLRKNKPPYREFRKGSCAINIKMNANGKKAPAFRRGRKPKPLFREGSVYEDRDLSNDRQILDLHWLYLNRRDEIYTEDSEVELLFAQETFDFDLASRLVKELGRSKTKVRVLGLREEIQMELSTMVSSKIREYRSQVLRDERRHVLDVLRNKSKKLTKAQVEIWADTYVAIRLARGSLESAKKLYALIRSEDPAGLRDNKISNKRYELEHRYLSLPRAFWAKTENPFMKGL